MKEGKELKESTQNKNSLNKTIKIQRCKKIQSNYKTIIKEIDHKEELLSLVRNRVVYMYTLLTFIYSYNND